MSRRLPIYTPAQITDAIARARNSTGWSDGDNAAFRLAGWQADDVAISDARRQVNDWLAQQAVEG